MFSLDSVQEAILDFIEAEMPQPVVEQAIPDTSTVKRGPDRQIEPYIAIQFGDIQQGTTRSMAGVRGDDYVLPVYVQAIAKKSGDARRISNKFTNLFLGETFPYAGSVRKRSGGAMWPITNSNSATEAYMFPASFGVLVELANYENPTP